MAVAKTNIREFPLFQCFLPHINGVCLIYYNGVIIKRNDTNTMLEEAANMIVHQVAEVKAKEVVAVVGDTDIFVCLLHFCCQYSIPTSTFLMVSPIRSRVVIYINTTFYKHWGHHPRAVSSTHTYRLRYNGNMFRSD